jgi:hypothetical protein
VTLAWSSGALMPELDPAAQTLLRAGYGLLLLAFLLMTLPHGRRFFQSERWGGYAQSSPMVDAVQNPVVYPLLMTSWLLAGALLVRGWGGWLPALWNLLLCRYFFVGMRWRGVARGMGAPGFMTYWLGAAVFLLQLTARAAPSAHRLALLVLQVDFAFIMLSAGIYKLSAGYPRNFGMEFGLANPQWGYWWRRYAATPPGHWIVWTLNQLAWTTEVVAAVLMLVPATRFVGALLIVVSFAFIATHIRLGFLCEMVILAGVLFFHPGSLGDRLAARVVEAFGGSLAAPVAEPWPLLGLALTVGLWGYLALLPLAHAGLFYNFYARGRLPGPLQRALEAYTNFFGIIIWRVFSVDVVNFFIRIHREPARGGARTLVSRYGWGGGLRYGHVCESVTVTSLFTTLKYYPSNADLFRDRLLRYARTVPCPAGDVLVFEYVSLRKAERRFESFTAAEYIVDLRAGTMEERVLDGTVSVRAAHAVSPVHEGLQPGTYVPLER